MSAANIQTPWLLSRDEFLFLIDELKPNGACSSHKFTGVDYAWVRHLERVEIMSFGVHQWIFNKALLGCEESLWKLNYGYNLYNEVIAKAKEETKFNNQIAKFCPASG